MPGMAEGETMKALTLHQPWASLVMAGAKPFEFRSWDYRRRYPAVEGQRIVIHAAVRPIRQDEVLELLERLDVDPPPVNPTIARPLIERLLAAHRCRGVLEVGAGLGTAVLGAPQLCTDIYPGNPDIDPEMWAWPLTEVRQWLEPQLRGGHQGFWNYGHRLVAGAPGAA